MITPTLNLPPLPGSSMASTKPALPAAAPGAVVPAAAATPAPSTTVTLSPQAMAAASHPSSSPAPAPSAVVAALASAPAHDGSVYDSLKNGISSAVTDVGDVISDGAHAVVEGVETTLSTANNVAKGILELPFAAASKVADAFGALIDEL